MSTNNPTMNGDRAVPAATRVLPCDPGANYRAHQKEIVEAVRHVLDGGSYILGREVAAFEEEFARYLGVADVVGVGNGTDALQLALRAAGVQPGDGVLTVSHTAVATVAAVELAGGVPLLVDVDPATYTMHPGSVEEAIHKAAGGARAGVGRPKAVVPVHLYGHPTDMPAIQAVAQRHGLLVIEDCAQAHGAKLHGRAAGAWGDLAAFSFYPTKNLGAVGDGGAVATNDPRLAARLRLLRQYGWRQRHLSEEPGMNTRLDELQAAVLRVKLRHLDAENSRRRQLARLYGELLADAGLDLPRNHPAAEHAYHQYVVRAKQRDELRERLQQQGIGTLIHYPVPVHLQPAYRGRLPTVVSLRHTERLVKQILSLPMYPELRDGQAKSVARHVRAQAGRRAR